jgi:glucose/arabinose dehydrogenase
MLSAPLRLIAVDINTNGTPRQATYQINAPGGSWDVVDNGTYAVTIQGNQVRDILGNITPETNLGGFQVAVAAPGILSLSRNSYTVNEADGTVSITVQRTGNTADAVSVDYQTLTGTATPEDFTPIAGTLNFASGETEQVIQVAIANDNLQEAPENFSITLDNVVGNANLLAPRTAQVTIIDDDSPTPPGNGNGLKAEYFNEIDFRELRLTRNDATVNFNWGAGTPDSRLDADTFSVRWSGEIEARFNEVYQFRTVTDDGVRLWINGQLIIDQFRDQAATSHTGTLQLQAGQRYTIQMDYYENLGDASAQLFWSSASQSEELVPQSQLFSPDTPATGVDKETIVSGLNQPTAVDWSPAGDLMFVAEKAGIVKVYQNGELLATPFIDIANQVNDVRDRGLLDIAVHPDFPNQPYLYLLYTYDPPQVFQNTGLAGPDGRGNRAGRLIRVRANGETGFTTAIAGSEEVILGKNSTWDNFNAFVNSTSDFNERPAGINPDGTNVQDFLAADSESHTIGSVEFGPDGALYVSNGDGTSYNRVDPRTVRVQDTDNLSGKILRINPETGEGLVDNPFFEPADPNANRSKVFQLGLRNPFRFAVDDTTGEVWVGDVGWTQWEEINRAGPGANFGWPYYEGGNGTSLQTVDYQDLPAAQEFYNSGQLVTPSIFALNHAASGINAIIMGDIYRGNIFPEEYRGDVFFNDLGQGIVRNLNLNDQGQVESVATFDTGATTVVQIQTGPDGNLYYVDLDDGQVGRWTFA